VLHRNWIPQLVEDKRLWSPQLAGVNVSGILSLLEEKATNPRTSPGLQFHWKLPLIEYVQQTEIAKFTDKIFITTIVY
jgi:hypothetical protein